MRLAFLSLPVIACLLCVQPTRAEQVDLELVLAVDVSRSIDAEEFDLQRQGYAQAIRHPSVLRAIRSGEFGAIAVAYVEWSAGNEQRTVVSWQVIRDAESARIFTDSMLASPRSFAGYTSISGAIDHSVKLFGTDHTSRRQVIDVSGDGSNNSGRPVDQARDEALALGIIINGLAIINDKPSFRPEPKLDDYYTDNVIGGPGSFVIVAEDFHAFSSAILSKLIREVTTAPADDPGLAQMLEPNRGQGWRVVARAGRDWGRDWGYSGWSGTGR